MSTFRNTNGINRTDGPIEHLRAPAEQTCCFHKRRKAKLRYCCNSSGRGPRSPGNANAILAMKCAEHLSRSKQRCKLRSAALEHNLHVHYPESLPSNENALASQDRDHERECLSGIPRQAPLYRASSYGAEAGNQSGLMPKTPSTPINMHAPPGALQAYDSRLTERNCCDFSRPRAVHLHYFQRNRHCQEDRDNILIKL